MKHIYLCLLLAFLQFSLLEANKEIKPDTGLIRPLPVKPDIGLIRPLPVKPAVLIGQPSFPNPKPYRPHPDVRFRRDVEEHGAEEIQDDLNREKRSFAPGGGFNPPSSSQQGQGNRGSWGVSVNKDKGRGPQVRTEGQGNIYTSPKGNVRVDGQGHHEFGKGRKPDYGGSVKVGGRWRREVEENDEEENDEVEVSRMERSLEPPSKDRNPIKQHILINRPSPTIPEHEIRFRRDVPEMRKRINPNFGLGPLIYRPTPTFPRPPKSEIRFRREVDDDDAVEAEELAEDLNRGKRFAPGSNNFPGSHGGQQQDRGKWDVTVNKDKGRGPQIHTQGQGNVYTSPNGNVKVDAHGHHEFGKGRKPNYGGGVTVHGKWKRDLSEVEGNEENLEEELEHGRMKRFAPGSNNFPGSHGEQNQDRGKWDVTVNKDKGRGPQIHTQGQGNIYTSPNGNVKVDAHGHHEFGKGRKPNYGGGVTVHGKWRRDVSNFAEEDDEPARMKRRVVIPNSNSRPDILIYRPSPTFPEPPKPVIFRRSVEDEPQDVEDGRREKRFAPGGHGFPGPNQGQQQDRGSWGVTVNKDKGRGPQVHTQGQGNIYTSPNGNWKVDAQGHHEFGKGRKPDYGAGITVNGRWRREVEDQEEIADEVEEETARVRREANPQRDRGSWEVTVNKDKGRGPQVHTQGQGNIYTSPNGNWKVDAQGHHEFGKGRKPDYGAGVQVTGRWRRDVQDDEAVADEAEEEAARVRREANPQRDRGSVSVNVERGPYGGAQVKTDAQYNIYTSPSGNWQFSGNGYHQAGHGQKPSYGAGLSLTGRFRRDVDDEEIVEDENERVRREANPQKDRGSVSVNVERGPYGGPQVRTDANYNMYRSRNGNWEVNGNAYHQAGRGQKPSYGAGVSLTGRFRRDAEGEAAEEEVREKREANPQKDPKGSVSVSVNKDKGRGPQIRTDVNRNIYTSRDKSFRVDGSGYHEAGRGRKPDYGGRVTISKSF